MEERIRMDTAWVDSLTYDTVVEKKYMHYLPDDVILRAFKELNYSQYLIKSERLVPQKFTFYFAGKADTLPVLKGLNFDEKDAFVIEKNQRNDTIHYWVKDSLLFKQGYAGHESDLSLYGYLESASAPYGYVEPCFEAEI